MKSEIGNKILRTSHGKDRSEKNKKTIWNVMDYKANGECSDRSFLGPRFYSDAIYVNWYDPLILFALFIKRCPQIRNLMRHRRCLDVVSAV